MISCSDAKNLINNYIDGLLGETDCSSFEEHISCCEKCHNEYDMVKSMVSDLSEAKIALPADFAKKMHIALVNNQLKERENKKKSFFDLPYTKLTTVTAAALMIAVIGKFGVYDVYKDISSETLQTKTVSPAVENKETDLTEAVPETISSPPAVQVPEKAKENVKVVEVVKKVEDTKVDSTAQIESHLTANATDVVNKSEDSETVSPQVQPHTEEEVEEAALPLALARMIHHEQHAIEIETADSSAEITEEVVTAVPEASDIMFDAENTSETEETSDEQTNKPDSGSSSEGTVSVSNAGINATEEAIDPPEEENAEKGRFVLKESTESIPTIVEIYKSGEGNMPIIKNYLYTFLNGSEISETDGQITITIGSDEYESVMKKISINEYVKNITVGSAFDGKAIIIIK